MNHCVPDFDIEEEDSIPTSSALNRSKKSSVAEEEEIMELLWQNGQLVAHSQSQRSLKKSHVGGASEQREIRSEEETATAQQLFMQEDEMASWLHYPLEDSSFDRDFYGDLLYSAPVTAAVSAPHRQAVAVAPRPPVPPQRRLESSIESQSSQQRYQNFSLFSRPKGRIESGPSSPNKTGKESTVVDSNSNDTRFTTALESRVSCVADNAAQVSSRNIGCSVSATATNTSPAACEQTVSSSPGGSGASVSAASAEPAHKLTITTIGATAATTEDRKRKGGEADDSECQSEDVDFESAHAKKQVRGSTSTKRSRAAEVHNLSERRRRDRINEKMKALQELIPRCNKSDKASMLDEAIEYLKSLQMQVQMMSMGCGMVPVMFPGIQQYMPPMGMGMGMGMSMDMGMNRPMVPFPSVLPGSALQNPGAAPHLTPRFPMPGFHMPPVSLPDLSRIQATSQSDLMLNSLAPQNSNQARMSNFPDPYQQYLGLHQAQVPLAQNQAVQPSPSKPNSSREGGNPHNHQSG